MNITCPPWPKMGELTVERRVREFFASEYFCHELPGAFEQLVESFTAAINAETKRCDGIVMEGICKDECNHVQIGVGCDQRRAMSRKIKETL